MSNNYYQKLNNPESLKTHFEKKINNALLSLELQDYANYIRYLDELGEYINGLYVTDNGDLLQIDKNKKLKWLKKYILKNGFNNKYQIQNSLGLISFETCWRDSYLDKPLLPSKATPYQRQYTIKADLNRSTRRNINLAMQALVFCVEGNITPETKEEKILILDRRIKHAIASYRTKKQKVLNVIGKTLALLMALATGVTTSAAIAAFLASTWPVSIVAIIGFVAFTATMYSNWHMFANAVPNVLIDVFGKDHLFEGWTHYNDPDTGEKKVLSAKRKALLGLSVLITASVGTVNGALTYGFTLGLSKVAAFSFLAAGTLCGACLPPVGISLAIIFGTCITILMIKAFVNLIKVKNIKQLLKKPFIECEKFFDVNNEANKDKSETRLKIEKGITYGIVGMMCCFTLFGLTILQYNGGQSLGGLLNNAFQVTSSLATSIGYGVSMTGALIGQIPFVIESTVNTLMGIARPFQVFFSPSIKKDDIIPETSFEHQSEFILLRIAKKAVHGGLYGMASVCNAGLVAQAFTGIAVSFAGMMLAIASAAGACWNALAAFASSSMQNFDQDLHHKTSTARMNEVLGIKELNELIIDNKVDQVTLAAMSAKPRHYHHLLLFQQGEKQITQPVEHKVKMNRRSL